MQRRYITATTLYCAFIFLLSSSSKAGTFDWPFTFEGLDKICHMLLYGGLAAVISVGLHRSPKPASLWFQGFFPIVFATLYGVTDEIHQLFVPMREFDLLDIMADLAGAAAVQTILCYFWWRGSSRREASGS